MEFGIYADSNHSEYTSTCFSYSFSMNFLVYKFIMQVSNASFHATGRSLILFDEFGRGTFYVSEIFIHI